MPPAKETNVIQPTKGVFRDRPAIAVPAGGFTDCLNVRIRKGRLTNKQIGWSTFPDGGATALTLDSDPVMLIFSWRDAADAEHLIFGTTKNLYLYAEGTDTVSFLTRRYATGTVSINNGSQTATGSSTAWNSSGLATGDKINFAGGSETDPAAVWYEIDTITNDTSLNITTNFAESTVSGGNYTGRILFGGTQDDPWDADTFHNVNSTNVDRAYFTNNKVDPVMKWAPGDTQVTSMGDTTSDTFDFRCSIIKRWKNVMIYGNLSVDDSGRKDRPFSIRTSAPANPENTSDTGATELQIHGGPDELVALEQIGDDLAAYSRHSSTARVVLIQLAADPVIFSLRQVAFGVGAISFRTVANFGTFHHFLSGDGGMINDGISVEPFGEHVLRDVVALAAPTVYDRAMHHFDEANGDLHWIIPDFTSQVTSSKLRLDDDSSILEIDDDTSKFLLDALSLGGTLSYVYHYLELQPVKLLGRDPPPFTIRDAPWTAIGYYERESKNNPTTGFTPESDLFYENRFRLTLTGDENGNLYILNGADTQDGTAITSFARSHRIMLAAGRRQVYIRRIYPYFEESVEATANVTIKLHGADSAHGTLTELVSVGYDTTDDSKNFANLRAVARFAEIEYRTEDGTLWELAGWDYDPVEGGWQ